MVTTSHPRHPQRLHWQAALLHRTTSPPPPARSNMKALEQGRMSLAGLVCVPVAKCGTPTSPCSRTSRQGLHLLRLASLKT